MPWSTTCAGAGAGARSRRRPPSFDLSGAIGRGGRNDRADVARLETLLHRAGHYDVTGTGGPTGYFGSPQEDAIRAYQKARGLTVDGLVLPNGETMMALGAETPNAPQPGTDEVPPANRAPLDQEANAGAVLGRGVLAGSAGAGAILSQQEQERLRKAGKLPTRSGTNLLDLFDFSAPKPGNIFNGATVPGTQRDIVEDDAPTHTGHPPPPMPDSSPLESPGVPLRTESLPPSVRPETNPEDGIEIFPDQSGELPQLIVSEANQSEETKWRVTDLGDRFKKAGGPNTQIVAGGYQGLDRYRPERALLDKTQKGTKGAVFADTIVYDPDLDITIYIQDSDAYVDGDRLKPREADAAGRMFKLAQPRRFVVTFPKPRPGQTLNEEAADKFIRDVWARARADKEQTQPDHGNIYNPKPKP